MNYKVKRSKVGLTPYMVAKELGIDFEKYQLVEKKKLPLEGNLVDKFLSIVDPSNAKMIKMNHTQRLTEIKEYAKSGKLKELMQTRGYKKQTDLAKSTDISNAEVSRAINYSKTTLKPSDSTLERVYDFLMNPLNKNVEEKKEKEKENTTLTEEERKYYTDLMDKNFISRKKVAHELGCSVSTIHNLFSKEYYGASKLKNRFIEYMKQYETKAEEVAEEVNEEPKEEVKGLAYEDMLMRVVNNSTYGMPKGDKSITELIEENYKLKCELAEAKTQLRRYEKLIDRM